MKVCSILEYIDPEIHWSDKASRNLVLNSVQRSRPTSREILTLHQFTGLANHIRGWSISGDRYGVRVKVRHHLRLEVLMSWSMNGSWNSRTAFMSRSISVDKVLEHLNKGMPEMDRAPS